jgi:hypothetical protein
MFLITNFAQFRDSLNLLPAMPTSSERGVDGGEFANRADDGCAAKLNNAGDATLRRMNFGVPV